MKYAIAALALAVVLYPANSFAGCPDVSSGACCGTFWYTFSFDTSCASTSGSVSDSTLSCYSTPAHSFGTVGGSADYSMTIPYGYNSLNWSAEVYVDFDDPNSSSNNAVAATFQIWHNGVNTVSETFLLHGGNQGSLGCNLLYSSAYSAMPGDTLYVLISASKYNSNTTIKVSAPIIFGTH